MSKDSSVNYNQDNKKERLEKKLVKDIKVFPKKKKRKKKQHGCRWYKILPEHEKTNEYWKWKKILKLNIEKNIAKWKNCLTVITNYFH